MYVILALPESTHLSPAPSISAPPGGAEISLCLMQKEIFTSILLLDQLLERIFDTLKESVLLIQVAKFGKMATAAGQSWVFLQAGDFCRPPNIAPAVMAQVAVQGCWSVPPF